MRILVTGSAGFIGKSLVRALTKMNNRVIGIDKDEWKNTELYMEKGIGDFQALNVDIVDLPMYDLTAYNPIDLCIHLAALTSVDECRDNKEEAYKNNVYATFKVVEHCRKYEIPLIYAGSVSVYGDRNGELTGEFSPANPPTYYAVTKYIAEQLVKTLPLWMILRFGTTFGAEMRPVVAPYIFLKAALEKLPIPIHGEGNQTRNFIYIKDLIAGIIACKRRFMRRTVCPTAGIANEIINLAGSEAKSITYLAKLCNEIVWDAGCTTIHRSAPRPNDTMYENISCIKAQDLLGWRPKVKLGTGLRRVLIKWTENENVRSS